MPFAVSPCDRTYRPVIIGDPQTHAQYVLVVRRALVAPVRSALVDDGRGSRVNTPRNKRGSFYTLSLLALDKRPAESI